MAAAPKIIPFTHFEQLREGREIIRQEAEALLEVSRRLDAGFCTAVDLLLNCQGALIVTGMGKAGLIGQKVAATCSSLGIRAHFLHPADAVHGDLGCVHQNDVLLVLSNSGETDEVNSVLQAVKRLRVPIIAVTAHHHSTLSAQADVCLAFGKLREAGTWSLAPSTSTTAMLAIGDALALTTAKAKGFTPQQFAMLHPAGSLGRRLRQVTELMRPLNQIRLAADTASVREVFTGRSQPGRRSGAVLLVDTAGRLTGIFTDSDLARLLEQRLDVALDSPISDVMTRDPLSVQTTATFQDVIDTLSKRRISELPVLDEDRRPVGLIDITDVIGAEELGVGTTS